MVDHRADVEDMDGVNADKLFEAMEIEFGNIMDYVKVENIRNIGNIANVVEYIRNDGFEIVREYQRRSVRSA